MDSSRFVERFEVGSPAAFPIIAVLTEADDAKKLSQP
jgi:hypothetical protein